MADLLDVVKGAVTVALIVCAVRWLNTAKGSDSPKTYGEVAVYGIKWPLRKTIGKRMRAKLRQLKQEL